MNIISIKVPIVILISIALFSCKKDNNDVDALMPLATGNSWTYISYQLDKSSATTNSLTLSIGEELTVQGVSGYEFISGSRPFNAKFIVSNDNDGSFLTIGGTSVINTVIDPSIQYKKNAVKGESWNCQNITLSYSSGEFSVNPTTIICVDTDILVTTPIGEFHCIAYEYKPAGGVKMINYISVGVGMVKMEHFEDGTLFRYFELTDYTLN